MIADLKKIKKSLREEIVRSQSIEDLEKTRVRYMGRERGALTLILRSLKNLVPEKRKKVGQLANELREDLEKLLDKKRKELMAATYDRQIKKEWVDVTRPGIKSERGHLHPITRILREVLAIFSSMGFGVVEGPEVETEYYNFDALNIPANHPARDMWDTLWLKPDPGSKLSIPNGRRPESGGRKLNRNQRLLLRTHTSPVQIRYMEKHNPPIRIIVPGRVYRYEATDASHDIQFWQLEGLMVDKNISIANFKAVIQEFFAKLFRTKINIRLRPSYFPFTEPSFEVDISCIICGLTGCSVCKKSGWLELAGAGMVHPQVFKAAGYNPRNVQGFAFGMGLTRIAMMKYKIPDIRIMNSGDIRFLKQF